MNLTYDSTDTILAYMCIIQYVIINRAIRCIGHCLAIVWPLFGYWFAIVCLSSQTHIHPTTDDFKQHRSGQVWKADPCQKVSGHSASDEWVPQ